MFIEIVRYYIIYNRDTALDTCNIYPARILEKTNNCFHLNIYEDIRHAQPNFALHFTTVSALAQVLFTLTTKSKPCFKVKILVLFCLG